MWKRGAETLVQQTGDVVQAVQTARARWIGWRDTSTNRKILAASTVLVSLTVVCKLAAAGREMATAYWFGTGDVIDAFVVAFTVPTFVFIAVASAGGSALLPTYTRVAQHEGHAAANQLLRDTAGWFLVLLAGTSLLLFAASSWTLDVLAPGFGSAKQAIALELMRWLIPVVILRGIVSLGTTVLHCHDRFAATGLIPVLTPLAAILCMFSLGAAWGIRALAIGILIGSAAEAVAVTWLLWSSGVTPWPRWARPSPHVTQVFWQYLPLVVAAALIGSTTLIDNAMASQLGSGSVATLSYGRKIVALAISIPTVSVSRVIYPYFAKQVAARNWSQALHTLSSSRAAILIGSIPVTIALVALSRPLTTLILQRGAFDAASTQSVSWVQAMYALQIPFYTLSIIYVRLVSSMRMNHLLTIATLLSIVLNVILNYVLMKHMGVAGIALATSIVYAVSCGFMMIATHRALARKTRSDLDMLNGPS